MQSCECAAILVLASRQRPDGVAAVPPCPQTAVFANPGGSGVTPTEKEEAIMRIAGECAFPLDIGRRMVYTEACVVPASTPFPRGAV